jgi:hypothetical protein
VLVVVAELVVLAALVVVTTAVDVELLDSKPT